MLLLLSFQLIMGAILVFFDLLSLVVTAHLLISLIFLGILIWFWRSDNRRGIRENSAQRGIQQHINLLLLLLFLTIGLGAYIKHQDYGLACGWLTCGNSVLPASFPELLQTVH